MEMKLNEKQLEQCESSSWDFTDLNALFLNCTLKRSPGLSHTEGLINISRAIMEKNGVSVKVLRPVDHNIAYGVYPDMTEQGWEKDEWPDIYPLVKAANILVITHPSGWGKSPLFAPRPSSVFTQALETSTKQGSTHTMDA
jgi:hypothetical protein